MLPGMAWKTPEKLCPCIRALHFQLYDAFWEATGDDLVLIETLRSLERQHYYVSIGSSRTVRSKHLPQPPNHLSLAFDVCPASYLKMKLWHPRGEYWNLLGKLGTKLGLEWGGNWRTWQDKPHFQLGECQCSR